jgi:choline dehydrogenase-like flavoprotein
VTEPSRKPALRELALVEPFATTTAADLWKPDTAASPDRVESTEIEADVVIVGTGAGGATAAWALRDSGARVLLLEMGDWMPRESANWDPEEVYLKRRYKSFEDWVDDSSGKSFHPGLHDFVGGNTKVFGAAFPRFRASDFEAVDHVDGTSPAWPISYEDLEPYYEETEAIFGVHGDESQDPTSPPRRIPLPYPPVDHEPYVAAVVADLKRAGLHPSPVPLGVDRRPGGRCIRCKTCDGFPCQIDAKNDADVAAVRPALAAGHIRLLRNTKVDRIEATASGTVITGLSCTHHGRPLSVRAPRVVLACGSVRTALLMQQSPGAGAENGIGNGTDQVGRNYMQHVNTALTAFDPRRRNDVTFQKTVQINDWYFRGADDSPYPWGNIQALGKLQWPHLKAARPHFPKSALAIVAGRSIEWWVMSEDLPRPHHRVRIRPDGRVGVTWTPTNLSTHKQLIKKFASVMRDCGFPMIFHETLGIDTNSHQCGTARMGEDPASSVVNSVGQVHGVTGLWLADSSVFVSSAAVNPALTIAALSLRTVREGGVLN